MAGHYHHQSIIPGLGWYLQSQALITERLSVLIELIAPNKRTRLLLGEAVVRFGEKYLVHWSGMRFTRGLYGKRVDLALAELIMEGVRALK